MNYELRMRSNELRDRDICHAQHEWRMNMSHGPIDPFQDGEVSMAKVIHFLQRFHVELEYKRT